MGKLRALKLGILKGIPHTPTKEAAQEKLAGAMISKLKCLSCGHGSSAHKNRKSKYENMAPPDLFELIAATGFKGSGGFDECQFYYCDLCEQARALKDCPFNFGDSYNE